MDDRKEIMIKGLKQRIVEIVAEYEDKMLQFRIDATIELADLRAKCADLEKHVEVIDHELQLFRNMEMEVNNEKC